MEIFCGRNFSDSLSSKMMHFVEDIYILYLVSRELGFVELIFAIFAVLILKKSKYSPEISQIRQKRTTKISFCDFEKFCGRKSSKFLP